MLRRVRVLVVLASIVGALTVGAAGASAANWAGLGDSYAAGPLIPNQQLNPLGCLRSDHNFAHLAAAALGRSLADASCSGAKTDDMTAPQNVTPGPNPPQFNALTTDTQIVTLQIGGNDIGFTSILAELRHREPVRAPVPRPLRASTATTARRQDRRHGAEGGRGAAGDPCALPAGAGLRRQLRGDPPRDRRRLLAAGPDRVLRRGLPARRGEEPQRDARPAGRHATARASSTTTAPSIGRDACKSPSTRWVEPLVPVNLAAPFHPNARGEAGIAAVVVGAVSS